MIKTEISEGGTSMAFVDDYFSDKLEVIACLLLALKKKERAWEKATSISYGEIASVNHPIAISTRNLLEQFNQLINDGWLVQLDDHLCVIEPFLLDLISNCPTKL